MLLNKYPVDTVAQVRAAGRYFDEYATRMSDMNKLAYARGLAARAAELGEPVTEKIAAYAHAIPRATLEPAVRLRSYVTGGQLDDELAEIVKHAAAVTPDERVEMFAEFDKYHNLQRCYDRIPTPFASVYQTEKVANEMSGEQTWTSPTSDTISKSQFTNWVAPSSNRQLLMQHFDINLVEGLAGADGWQVFSSLPDPHKQVIARMAKDNVIPGNTGAGLSRYSVAGNIAEEQVSESAHERLKKLIG